MGTECGVAWRVAVGCRLWLVDEVKRMEAVHCTAMPCRPCHAMHWPRNNRFPVGCLPARGGERANKDTTRESRA